MIFLQSLSIHRVTLKISFPRFLILMDLYSLSLSVNYARVLNTENMYVLYSVCIKIPLKLTAVRIIEYEIYFVHHIGIHIKLLTYWATGLLIKRAMELRLLPIFIKCAYVDDIIIYVILWMKKKTHIHW